MSYALAQSSTDVLDFLMVDALDHITGATGKTVTVTLCKNGGAFGPALGSVSEIASGWYRYTPVASELNTLGPLLLHATAALCDPRDASFVVVNYNPSVILPSSPPTSATFGTIRALDLINAAMSLIQAKALGQVLTSDEALDAFGWLNRMIDSWGNLPALMPQNKREVFDLVAGQMTYTIGPGGDFDTVRPVWITGAGLLLSQLPTPVELPRPVINNAQYQSIQIKTYSSAYVTVVYYNMTYAAGLGEITLWPVPNTTAQQLVLYSDQAIPGFSSLTAQYVFPPGYTQAIIDNLACILADVYAFPLPQRVETRAKTGLSEIKRANTQEVTDLAVDPGILTRSAQKPYNILNDQTS
jgi:hypothetical protein